MVGYLAGPTSSLTARLRRGVRALSSALLATFEVVAVANTELSYDVWHIEDEGVPSTATSVVQSRDGYVWVGTYSGLARLDGARLVLFTSGNTPGLRSSRITSLHIDSADTLWIGHETGELSRLVRGGFESVPLPGNWQGGAIEAIVQDAHSDFWILSEKGKVVRLRDGEELEVPGGASASRKAALIQGNDREPWICANGRVACIERGKMVEKRLDDTETGAYYDRILPAREGGLWVYTGGTVKRWHNGGWAQTAGQLPPDATPVNALLETRSGTLVAGTLNNGVYLFRAGLSPTHINRGNGLSHDWVRTLYEDKEGNLWVGSGGGVDTLRTRKVAMMTPPDLFLGRVLLSVTKGSQGEVWIGTEGAGLYRKFQEEWTRYDESTGLSNVFVWSVLETRKAELLVGTWGGGLQRLRANRFETPIEFSQITAPVVALFEAREGTVWIGTTSGLWCYGEGKTRFVAGAPEVSFPDVRTIAQTADGALWFGMLGGGLGVIRDGRVTQIRKAQGLSSDYVQSLLAEPDGTLWIGSSDNGICRLKEGKFSQISLPQGLPSEVVTHLVDDGNGQLWIGSNRGIFRAAKAELNRCADGEIATIAFFSFGRSEGLTSSTCSGGFQPGASRTSEGLLWFPTAKGLATIDPSRVRINPIPPPVVIEALLVGGRSVDWRSIDGGHSRDGTMGRLRIPSGAQRFEFRYTAPSFTASEKVRFRYRLKGLEDTWGEEKSERSAPYSYLSPGEYTFQVIACNNDGLWNERGAALTFTVLPAFYQTWWFSGLMVLAGAGAVGAVAYWISRRRLRRRLEQLERQRALERERARIARDIHDDLGASLTRITLLSQSVSAELEGAPQARAEVDQIYQTARDLTRAMDEIVWAVNPKHDTLDSLVNYLGRFAQNFMSTAGIRCRLDAPMEFPHTSVTTEIRHNVFLAFKEALNNVIKHARATEARVILELLADRFTLAVVDNGCGFKSERDAAVPAADGESTRAASGNGLANMQKRLEEIGGHCKVITAPGEGTRVEFSIPLTQ